MMQMMSGGPNHDEFDFEFLGNQTGQPYLLHTNIFVNGTGGREEQIYLPFDPTADYHYYNFQWHKDLVVFYVDNTPIRMFRNLYGIVRGFPFPDTQAMSAFASIWDGSQWATEGGRIKVDWTAAPFVARYQNFRLNGCLVNSSDKHGILKCRRSSFANAHRLSMARIRQMRTVKATLLKYNYCDDRARYPTPPPECAYNVL
jgi:xyloglucan:xyloglucosyl transferase